jgi:dihydropyrimidinase
LLDDSVYDPGQDDREVLPYVLSPPLRSREDREELWERLADGTFDVVATDHCPFNIAGQKERGLTDFTKIPNGAGSIRNRMNLLYTYGVLTQRISFSRFVGLVSTRPAEIFGYGNSKGKLLPGYDADLVIWNPDYQEEIMADRPDARCDCDIYEGFRTLGKADVILSGHYSGKRSDRD